MAVRIRLNDGSVFVVDQEFAALQKDIETAIEADVPLFTVRNGSGQRRSINPLSIAFIEEIPDDELTPAEEQVLEAVHQSHRQGQPQ